MKSRMKCLGWFWALALLLSALWMPPSAFSGICEELLGEICCENDSECPSGYKCLPYSGMCNGFLEYCNTDADCPLGEFCASIGWCEIGHWPCFGEQTGWCGGDSFLCRTDADCAQWNRLCIVNGICSDGITICSTNHPEIYPCPGGGVCGGFDGCFEEDQGSCDFERCATPVPYDYTESTTPEDPLVQAPDGATVNFATVTTSGETTVAKDLGTPELPGGFSLLIEPCFVYNIETTAGIEPPIEVCVPYDEPEPPIEEASIRLFHEEEGVYVDRTVSLDTENNVVCAQVSGFSGFVVAHEEGGPSYAPNAVASALGSASVAGSGVFNEFGLLLIPIGAVIFLRFWRRGR